MGNSDQPSRNPNRSIKCREVVQDLDPVRCGLGIQRISFGNLYDKKGVLVNFSSIPRFILATCRRFIRIESGWIAKTLSPRGLDKPTVPRAAMTRHGLGVCCPTSRIRTHAGIDLRRSMDDEDE